MDMYKDVRVSGDRLDRVESILEKVAERLDQLVKLEVRHDNTVYRVQRSEERIEKLESKVETLSDTVTTNSMVTGATERFGWIIVSSMIGLAAYFLR